MIVVLQKVCLQCPVGSIANSTMDQHNSLANAKRRLYQ
jgi:hypothetical protein